MICSICQGRLWVCEFHKFVPWEGADSCCGGAGIPCFCNRSEPPSVPKNFIAVAQVDVSKRGME